MKLLTEIVLKAVANTGIESEPSVVFYNFPEPQQKPEALYGAVLKVREETYYIGETNDKDGKYFNLEEYD